jgi:hypothetical protein
VKHSPPSALNKFLRPYDSEIRNLALGLRALVLEEMALCYENLYDAYSAAAIRADERIMLRAEFDRVGFQLSLSMTPFAV